MPHTCPDCGCELAESIGFETICGKRLVWSVANRPWHARVQQAVTCREVADRAEEQSRQARKMRARLGLVSQQIIELQQWEVEQAAYVSLQRIAAALAAGKPEKG